MALLLQAGEIAESLLCRLLGCFRTEAGGHLLLSAQFEVKTHLFIEFALKPATVEQHGEPSFPFARKTHGFSSSGLDDSRNGAHHPLELRYFNPELLFARARKRVVPGAAVAGRHTPLRRHPTFDQHPLQRRIERTFFYLQYLVGAA